MRISSMKEIAMFHSTKVLAIDLTLHLNVIG
jgi:hypothetical protein